MTWSIVGLVLADTRIGVWGEDGFRNRPTNGNPHRGARAAPSKIERTEFDVTDEMFKGASLKKGRGCSNCFNTGYQGRAAVYEVLTVDNALRSLIRREATVEEIIEQARAGGMKLLYEAGVLRVLKGVTTFEEVRRVLSEAQ